MILLWVKHSMPSFSVWSVSSSIIENTPHERVLSSLCINMVGWMVEGRLWRIADKSCTPWFLGWLSRHLDDSLHLHLTPYTCPPWPPTYPSSKQYSLKYLLALHISQSCSSTISPIRNSFFKKSTLNCPFNKAHPINRTK